MRNSQLLAICLALMVVGAAASDDKGQCPGFLHPGKMVSSNGKEFHPRKPQEPAQKPEQGAEYLGRVTLSAAVSNRGYVCDAAIQFGIDPKIDESVLQRFKDRHFAPVEQKGKPVPVNVTVYINVWRTTDGRVVDYPEPTLPKL